MRQYKCRFAKAKCWHRCGQEKSTVRSTVNQKGQSQNPLQLPFLFIPLFCFCDLCDFFQLMCDNLIACLNANQIHTIQPDKFPNNHILLYCCNPNLHPSFEFLALERKHIDRKQLLTTVNRALIKGLNHIGFSRFPCGAEKRGKYRSGHMPSLPQINTLSSLKQKSLPAIFPSEKPPFRCPPKRQQSFIFSESDKSLV